MRRIRPTELKAVVSILLEGLDEQDRTQQMKEEANEMGTDIIQAIDALREKRTDWYVIKKDPGVGISLHGPYVTKDAAHKAIGREIVAASTGASGYVIQLIPSEYEGVLPL